MQSFEDERAIFVGAARDPLAYTGFESLGASSLEYRVGTLDFPTAPYDGDDFFATLEPLRVLDDGRLLFFGLVRDAATDPQDGLNLSPGLWLHDGAGLLTELVAPRQMLPTVNGDPVSFYGDFFLGSFIDSAPLQNGDVIFPLQTIDGDVIVRISLP